MGDSFVTINRKITEWQWYANTKVFKLFLHCIIKANWRDKKWMDTTIKRGSFVTSYGKLSEQTGLSVKEIRNALDKLVSSGEVKLNEPKGSKRGKAYTLVSVCKYSSYQTSVDFTGTEGAQEGHRRGTEGATTNNSNNNNKSNKDIIYYATDENFSKTLENERYVEAFTKKFRMTKERLEELYGSFNDHLVITDDGVKTNSDYISHFLNWYCKTHSINRSTGKRIVKHKNSL